MEYSLTYYTIIIVANNYNNYIFTTKDVKLNGIIWTINIASVHDLVGNGGRSTKHKIRMT